MADLLYRLLLFGHSTLSGTTLASSRHQIQTQIAFAFGIHSLTTRSSRGWPRRKSSERIRASRENATELSPSGPIDPVFTGSNTSRASSSPTGPAQLAPSAIRTVSPAVKCLSEITRGFPVWSCSRDIVAFWKSRCVLLKSLGCLF